MLNKKLCSVYKHYERYDFVSLAYSFKDDCDFYAFGKHLRKKCLTVNEYCEKHTLEDLEKEYAIFILQK